MTQTGVQTAPTIKKVTMAPLCSLKEARKRFEGKLLNESHVKLRLTKSTHIVSPEGETKVLFLKNILDEPIVKSAWRTLSKLTFSLAKTSRRAALRDSGDVGGEVLFGWMNFPKRARGVVPVLTSQSKGMWREFRELWFVLYCVQHWYHHFLPKHAKLQMAKAVAARGSIIDALLDKQTYAEPETDTLREEVRECFTNLERDDPEQFQLLLYHALLVDHPEYIEQLRRAEEAEKHGVNGSFQVGPNDGELMTGYTIPGTMFSTLTVNRTALFRSHEDGSNLPGGLACLAAFGDFAGGDLCFPRFGVSCPLAPGDLLICDSSQEQHGNIGPLSGERISIVAYMRDDFAK